MLTGERCQVAADKALEIDQEYSSIAEKVQDQLKLGGASPTAATALG